MIQATKRTRASGQSLRPATVFLFRQSGPLLHDKKGIQVWSCSKPNAKFLCDENKFWRWNCSSFIALIGRVKTRRIKNFHGVKLLDMMRTAFIVLISCSLTACSSTSGTHAGIPKPKMVETDSIQQLVNKLSASSGYWAYGIFTPVDLPASASTAEVISQYCDSAYGDNSHRIITIRRVCIGISIPADYYTAVLIDTVYGRKIVLLQYQESNAGWWCKEYDANPATTNTPQS
jgi:hypothetical protein